MASKLSLEQFNKQYKYKTDKKLYGFFEVWTEPTEVNGVIEGDCEDYCIYLKKNVKYFKDWDYYYCKLNGVGHCVLYKKEDIIDCNTQKIVSFEQYCKLYKVTEFKKYNWFTIFSKLLFAKIFKIIGRIND